MILVRNGYTVRRHREKKGTGNTYPGLRLRLRDQGPCDAYWCDDDFDIINGQFMDGKYVTEEEQQP